MFGTQGTDESGMSTLIKQMQIAYAPGTISAAELESIRFELWSNLLNAFYITLTMIDENHWKYKSDKVTVDIQILSKILADIL